MRLSYSIQEVSQITGIGRTKIYEAINKGVLPAKKYGRRTLILYSDLIQFVEQLGHYPPSSN